MMGDSNLSTSASPLLRSGEFSSARARKQLPGKSFPKWYSIGAGTTETMTSVTSPNVFQLRYTPSRLLGLFCWVTFLVYLDRGLLASNGINSGISSEFKLGDVENGTLPAVFMVGLLIASLVYSELTKTYNAFRLIGWGFVIWTLCSIGCGLAKGFWSFLVLRVIMGAGEASIVNLTGPYIDDVAPPKHKTMWFGILFLFPTLGIAAGYIFGGIVGLDYGWRIPFFIQAAVALPVVLFLLVAPPIALENMKGPDMDEAMDEAVGQEEAEEGDTPGAERREEDRPLTQGSPGVWADLRVLGCHPVYMFSMLAACPNSGVFGALSYWGPHAGNVLFEEWQKEIDVSFGLATIMTAVVATLAGAWLVDHLGSSIRTSMLFCGISTLLGFGLLQAAFAIPDTFPVFLALFALGEVACFAGTAPAMTVTVWSVPTRLRPLASGMAQVAGHVLGDVPSPPLVGLLQGFVHNWRWTLGIMNTALLVGTLLYFIGAYVPCTDYRLLQKGLMQDEQVEPAGQEPAAAESRKGAEPSGTSD